MHFSNLLQDLQRHGRHLGRTGTSVVPLDLQSCPDSHREGCGTLNLLTSRQEQAVAGMTLAWRSGLPAQRETSSCT